MRTKFYYSTIVLFLLLLAVTGCNKQSAATDPEAAAANETDKVCARNLEFLASAKKTWAESNHKTADDTPSMEDLMILIRRPPVCPGGGTYTIGKVGELPTCSIPAHNEAFKKLLANPNPNP